MSKRVKGGVVLCDIDHTLCHSAWRDFFIHYPMSKKEWMKYHELFVYDAVNLEIMTMINCLYRTNIIVLFSSRNVEFREETNNFLDNHHIKRDHLLLRPKGDENEPSISKFSNWKRFCQRKKCNPIPSLVIDDDENVLNVFRYYGATCMQVKLPDVAITSRQDKIIQDIKSINPKVIGRLRNPIVGVLEDEV